MKRLVAAGSALAVGLFGLVAAPSVASAASCVPKLEVLSTVAGPSAGDTAVLGLSDYATKAAVGVSNGLPVYWKNGVIKKVPLPAGYTTGRVTAVNHFGLMVGTVSGPTKAPRAFRYWSDQLAIGLYAKGTIATDVNNAGRAVGYDAAAGYEYGPGTSVRRSLSVPTGFTVSTVTGISDAGRIIGNGSGLDDASETYPTTLTWSAASGSVAAELQPTTGYLTENTPEAMGIDNLNRIVGAEAHARNEGSSGVYWSSPTTTAEYVDPPILDATALTAISQTNRIVVGYAFSTPGPDARAYVAIVWRPGAGARSLPSLDTDWSSQALAVDNDGRAAGYSGDRAGVRRPVVWNCAHRF